MKTCSKCRVEKDDAEFPKRTSGKDGLDSRCRACWREYRQTDAVKESKQKINNAYRQTDSYKEYVKAHQQTDS